MSAKPLPPQEMPIAIAAPVIAQPEPVKKVVFDHVHLGDDDRDFSRFDKNAGKEDPVEWSKKAQSTVQITFERAYGPPKQSGVAVTFDEKAKAWAVRVPGNANSWPDSELSRVRINTEKPLPRLVYKSWIVPLDILKIAPDANMDNNQLAEAVRKIARDRKEALPHLLLAPSMLDHIRVKPADKEHIVISHVPNDASRDLLADGKDKERFRKPQEDRQAYTSVITLSPRQMMEAMVKPLEILSLDDSDGPRLSLPAVTPPSTELGMVQSVTAPKKLDAPTL